MCPGLRSWSAGIYLAPAEIPIVEASIDGYLATLDRLEALVGRADWVVPGHGEVLDGTRPAAVLREDRAYVEGLRDDPAGTSLPLVRRGAEQRRLHGENLDRLGGQER